MLNGLESAVLLVDKPAGKTSFSIVRAVRRLSGIKKVGHAGTLDPFATGLLVVCIGRGATRLISQFMDGEKEYEATLCLGKVSSTLDPEGEITDGPQSPCYSNQDVASILRDFTGSIMQHPPAYSALKHKGKPLYHYARRGIKIEKPPRQVHIKQLEWLDRRDRLDGSDPSMRVRVRCSKGTYIRSLAADIGDRLGCGAYLTALRRTRSGFFSVAESIPGEALFNAAEVEIGEQALLSVEQVQKHLQK
jgi:tRNA pseudouridine55 synthase